MARVKLNQALKEIRGTIDGLTFRKTPDGGVSVYAGNPSEKQPSESQRASREAFARAQHYAKRVLTDPLQRIVYKRLAEARKRPTNNLLVANYRNPPTIEVVELAGYTGGPQQEIAIIATDDIAVASVTLEIRGADSALYESGMAKEQHGVWRYRTTSTLPAETNWRVEVTATNRAGHAAIVSQPDPRNPGAGPPTHRTQPPTN